MAVNVAVDPKQLGFVPVVIATATVGGGEGIKVMVVPALVAVLVLKQDALEVIVHVIISLFASAVGV